MYYVVLALCILGPVAGKTCMPRDMGNGGTVCVCSATYCDTVAPVQKLPPRNYVVYTSSKAGARFQKSTGIFKRKFQLPNNSENERLNNLQWWLQDFNSMQNTKVQVKIDASTRYQTILGWGGAFTDATGINIRSLNETLQNDLLRSYFSNEGLEYSLCRVPIGGTDFSTRAYTYDDIRGDVNLTSFNLTVEDYLYKIPYIKKASDLMGNKLNLFASAWGSPGWMKTNNNIYGPGKLYSNLLQVWADYHLKFFKAYEREGINFWGMTTGNEPSISLITDSPINALLWSAPKQAQWIANNLGPTIKANYPKMNIMCIDDQRYVLPWLVNILLSYFNTTNYIDGIAVHWYFDNSTPVSVLNTTHYLHPDKFLLATEASIFGKPLLGSWDHGELYATDIIEDLLNWSSGWTDWNMVLDLNGGPTYINNILDAPIIVNYETQEFYKQPMYYVIGHFSKFIPPGSVRIHTHLNRKRLKVVAFEREDNGTALVLYNDSDNELQVNVDDLKRGSMTINSPAHSIQTVLYW